MTFTNRSLIGMATMSLLAGTMTAFGVASPAMAATCDFSAPITSDVTCTVSGSGELTSNYTITTWGGGGGGDEDHGTEGGAGAKVTSTVSIPIGATVQIVIGQGGFLHPDGDGSGGGGGGSTAVIVNGQLVVEAGAGGGGGGGYDGGNAGGANGAGLDPAQGTPELCADGTYTAAKGGNQDGLGSGGAPGTMVESCASGWGQGTAGQSVTATSNAGNGGLGGNSDSGVAGPTGVDGGAGGTGYRSGGAGGGGSSGGAGGGGAGWGGGGGGASDGGYYAGAGGGGGSYVNPAFSVDTPVYEPSPDEAGQGGYEEDGHAGQVAFTAAGGPAAQTEAAAASATHESATLHSKVNANGDPITSMAVKVSRHANLSDSVDATITPTTATGVTDTAVTGHVSGLAAGTTYHYQLTATNSGGTAKGLVASFTTAGIGPDADKTCPLQVIGARPKHKRLPIGKKVTLVKRMVTVPECTLNIGTGVSKRGDVRAAIKIHVNKKTGKVVAIAHRADAKAKVGTRALPKRDPYVRPSGSWKRNWIS